MPKDYTKEARELIQKYSKKEITYAKPLSFFLNRVNSTKEEIEKEIKDCENLIFTEKQQKGKETRYKLYFFYSKKQGRVYVLTFTDKIVVITLFPIGKRTLRRYRKKDLYSQRH